MTYPFPVMRKTALMKMGFSETFLMKIYNMKGQTIAWKLNPSKSNSPIMFDTDELEKYRKRNAK